MSKEEKEVKKERENNTKSLKSKVDRRLIIGCFIVIIGIIAVILVLISNRETEENKTPSSDGGTIVSTEESVEEEYGFSKEDAINSIKGVFNSDVYEFDATVREDNMYIVTVTNTETGSVYTYVVDPNDGSFQELVEE